MVQVSSVAQLSQARPQATNSTQSFGSVLANLTSQTTANQNALVKSETGSENKELLEVLQAQSVEELVQILGELQQGEEFAIGENLTLNELSKLLGKDLLELTRDIQTIADKLGIEIFGLEDANDYLSLLQIVAMNQQQLAQLFAMNGNDLSSNDEQSLVQFTALLHALQLKIRNSDLLSHQEQQLSSLSDLLKQLQNEVSKQQVTFSVPSLSLNNSVHSQTFSEHVVVQQHAQSGQQQEQTTEQKTDSQLVAHSLHATKSGKVEFVVTNANRTANQGEVLVKEIQAIMKRANFGQVNGSNRLLIKLYPEHLGQLRIELVETNGLLTARILASTAAAKELLDSQLHQLRQGFQQQNLQVERIELTQSIQEPSKSMKEQSSPEQFERFKEQHQQEQKEDDEEQVTFEEFLIELEV